MSFRDDREALLQRLAELEGAETENARLRARVGEPEQETRHLNGIIEQLRAQESRRRSAPPAAMPGAAGAAKPLAPMRPRMLSRPTGGALLTLRIRGPISPNSGGDPPKVRDETFDRDVIKIGRVPSCHLLFEHADVSRIHAIIERTESGFLIIDLGSSEGTLVNGNKINKTTIKLDDEITIGPFLLTVAAIVG